MAKAKKRRAPSKGTKGCHCPANAKKITTKGRGRGWACQSKTASKGYFKPFVAAIGCHK